MRDVVGRERRIGHEETCEILAAAVFVQALFVVGAGDVEIVLIGGADGVLDGPGDGGGDAFARTIAETVTQKNERQAGGIGIERDKGRDGFEGDGDGEAIVVEVDARGGEFADEGCALEAREAWHIARAETFGTGVGRLDTRFEDVGHGRFTFGLDPEAGEGVLRRIALIGAIEDLPIA